MSMRAVGIAEIRKKDTLLAEMPNRIIKVEVEEVMLEENMIILTNGLGMEANEDGQYIVVRD